VNIPDNYDQWEAHDREKEEDLAELPVCEICGEPIQDEHLYLINDEFVCHECLVRDFRKNTDDYIKKIRR
jgi:formylmethanofuran dehydrogenase subunit E